MHVGSGAGRTQQAHDVEAFAIELEQVARVAMEGQSAPRLATQADRRIALEPGQDPRTTVDADLREDVGEEAEHRRGRNVHPLPDHVRLDDRVPVGVELQDRRILAHGPDDTPGYESHRPVRNRSTPAAARPLPGA